MKIYLIHFLFCMHLYKQYFTLNKLMFVMRYLLYKYIQKITINNFYFHN